MKYSLNIGRPFGIRIAIHWTFLLLIPWIVAVNMQQGAGLSEILTSILFILALFFCVTLHELGHSLAARRYNIETRSITLLPIGGMANIEEMPEKPGQEIVVTLAGLVVNVIIAILLWAVIAILPGLSFRTELQAVSGENFLVMLMYFLGFCGDRCTYGVHTGETCFPAGRSPGEGSHHTGLFRIQAR